MPALDEGSGPGWPPAEDYFEALLDEYYAFKGWDPATALQTRRKLEELRLEDVAQVLAREHALT